MCSTPSNWRRGQPRTSPPIEAPAKAWPAPPGRGRRSLRAGRIRSYVLAFVVFALTLCQAAPTEDRSPWGSGIIEHPFTTSRAGKGWLGGARDSSLDRGGACGGEAGGVALGRGPAPGMILCYRTSCISPCKVGSTRTHRRRQASHYHHRDRPLELVSTEAGAGGGGAADVGEEEEGRSAVACDCGLLHHDRLLVVHHALGIGPLNCVFIFHPRPLLLSSCVWPYGLAKRSAAFCEGGGTACGALEYSGGQCGNAKGGIVVSEADRAGRPSRLNEIYMDLGEHSTFVVLSLRSGSARSYHHPARSDEAVRSAGRGGNLLTGPGVGVIPRRHQVRKDEEMQERGIGGLDTHSDIDATIKVVECMWPHGGAAEDWKDTNPRRWSGCGGRCGNLCGCTLCDNAYSPAEKEMLWFARGSRRYGTAPALILCGYVDADEPNHTSVGRGVRRGGRCVTRWWFKFCSSVYLAWRRVVANGEACWRCRCRFRSRYNLCANVFAGKGGEAVEGRIEDWRCGEKEGKKAEGQGAESRGTGGVEGDEGHAVRIQEHQATTQLHTQVNSTFPHTCGHTHLGIGHCTHHLLHRRHHTEDAAPLNMDIHSSHFDGDGEPAEGRNGPRMRRPSGAGQYPEGEEEREASREEPQRGSIMATGITVDAYQCGQLMVGEDKGVGYVAEHEGVTNDVGHPRNSLNFGSFQLYELTVGTMKGMFRRRCVHNRCCDDDAGVPEARRTPLVQQRCRRRPAWADICCDLAQWIRRQIWIVPWLTWWCIIASVWKRRRGVGDEGRVTRPKNGRRRSGRGAARPLWLGTRRWAIECTRVRRWRRKRNRLSGSFRILRLGDREWWREEWRPWNEDSLQGHQSDGGEAELPRRVYPLTVDGSTTHGWTSAKARSRRDTDDDPSRTSKADAWPRGNALGQRRQNGRRRLVGYGTGKAMVATVMAAALVGLRIGEASHPGFGIQDPDLMQLKEVTLEGKLGERLTYADPDKLGFRGGKSPGFHKEDRLSGRSSRTMQESRMVVESANVTGPAGLRTRLRATRADILLAQETWATEESIPDLREWARKQKWTSLWAPAKPGTNGGRPSGGAAIFVRNHLGLREPDVGGPVWHQHRACAGVVEVPGYRPTTCVAAYFQSGEGWGSENRSLMAAICAGLEAQGMIAGRIRPSIIGLDANMTPEEFQRCGVGEKLGLQVVRPLTARGTFRTRNSARCIDFYLMGGGMTEVVEGINTVEAAGITGHTPVQVDFQPRATAKKCLVARPPPRIPTERTYGPLPPPPCYKDVVAKAEAAWEAARRPELNLDKQRLLDEAYAALANNMERELCDVTGTKLPTYGKRAENPCIVWRSVLHERQA